MDKLLKQFGVRRQEDKTRSSCNLCKSCDNLFDVSRKDVGRYPLRPELTSYLPVRVVRDDLSRKNSEERVPPLAKAKRVIGALTSAGKNLTNIQMVESHLVDLCERAKMFGNVNEDNDLYKSNSFRFQKVRERIPVKPKPEVAVEENYSFPLDLVVKRRPVAPARTISIQRDRKVRVAEAYEDPSDSKYYCEPGEDRLAKIYGDTHYTQPYLDGPRSHKTGRLKDANENAYEDISTSYDYDSKDRLVTRIRINRPTEEEQETLIDLVYEDEYIDDRLSDLIENGTLRSEFDNELYFSPTEVIPEYSKVDAQHLLKKRTKKYKRYSVACDENFETDGTLRRSAFNQVHTLTIPVGDEYSTLTKDKALSSCPTLIDEPYYELVVVGGDSLPLLDDICRTLSAQNGTDYYLSEIMRRKQLYETAFDSRVRTDGQINTPDMENRNSILRRFWKGKNRSKLSPSDSKTSENIENDNFKIPRSRRIDNFTDEKNSETSVTKNDIDTSSIISLPVTPPSSVPLVPKFKRPASLTDSKISVSSITRQIDNLRVDNCTCPPNKNVPKNRYASSDSMASTGSTMSSLESLRSSTSESARSTSSSLSSHSSDDQSKKRQSLSLDLASRLQPRSKPALTLNPKKFQQMLSPISDKSQDVSSENRGSTSTASPDDSERAKPEEPNPLENGPPKKPSRKSLSLQLSAGNYPYVSVQSDHASDSGISLGPTKDEGGCEDVPFPMPKLRKRTQIKTVLSGGPSSAKSSPVEELPFPMPKLRRRPNSMISTREACPPQGRPQISPENEPMLFPMPKLRRKPNIGSDVRGENKNNLVLNFHNPIGGEKLTNLKLETKSNRSSLSLDIGSVPRNNAMNRSSLTLDFSSSMNILGEPVDPTIPLDKQTWFHGAITRVEAENILRSKPSGSYLVRNSESSRNEYSLSLKSARGFMHMRIQRTSVTQNIGPCDITVEHFVLGQFSKPFQTIPEMIRHYSVNKLPIKGAEHMCLLYPVIDQCL